MTDETTSETMEETSSGTAKIVLQNMRREEEKRAIEDLTEIGYNREVIQIER